MVLFSALSSKVVTMGLGCCGRQNVPHLSNLSKISESDRVKTEVSIMIVAEPEQNWQIISEFP